MIRNFCIYFTFLLLFTGSHSRVFSSAEIQKNEQEIGIEYFDKLLKNDYILGPGDTLFIIISREIPELANAVSIDSEGTIYLPKLNRIYVEGLTINELKSTLNKAYKQFVKRPSVEIIVKKYRPVRVLIDGEVENPGLHTMVGSYSISNSVDENIKNMRKQIVMDQTGLSTKEFSTKYQNELFENQSIERSYYFPRVFDAIKQSGGITEFSDLKNIQIIRVNKLSEGGGKIETFINFENLLKGDNTQNIRIYDNDIIRVARSNKKNNLSLANAISTNLNPKFIEVFVAGRVRDPGKKKISRASVLSDAVDIAGGAKTMRGPATFIRFNNDGTVDKRRFNFKRNRKRESFKNPLLRNGDLIVIGDSKFTNANEVVNELTSPFIGIFSTYALIQAISE